MPKTLPDIVPCPWIKSKPRLVFGFCVEQYSEEWNLRGPVRQTPRGAINAWNRVVEKCNADD